ncbi:hypothetical protein EV678_1619 [Azospira oryzae]|uniref:Uncharacterized protein n=1 Tax=Azospira oryzae TaxID=146939 RepID=A0ABY0IT88_9RHOO|nr:hypothetical protein EV678_1619 [Azospira oryzae]
MRCVVSHDAGGAEILASYVVREGGDWLFVLEGPARKVFTRRLGAVACSSLVDAIEACDEVLTGSSWQSDLEWRAIGAARQAGKRVVTFLDHWVNYRERFIRTGIEHLPDAILVGDHYAKAVASRVFPDIEVMLVMNPYFEDMKHEFSLCYEEVRGGSARRGLRVLFVSEPISEHALLAHGNPRQWGYTEFDAIRYLHGGVTALGGYVESLVIRPHPAEAVGKYDSLIAEMQPLARLGGGMPLIREIMESDVVVGCESMAMAVALIAGRRVVSAIPPGGRPCVLPHREIESLSELVARRDSQASM